MYKVLSIKYSLRNWKLEIGNSRQRRAGFTLIELLVVVAIIGILSTLIMANFIGVRQRARDAQRKSDLRQIQSSLEIYRSDIGSYKVVTPGGPYELNTSSCPTSSSFAQNNATYMQTVPCDPLGAGATIYNGSNYYYNSDGSSYTLAACLENAGDTDQKVVTIAPTPAATTHNACDSGHFYVLNNP